MENSSKKPGSFEKWIEPDTPSWEKKGFLKLRNPKGTWELNKNNPQFVRPQPNK